MLGEIGEHGLEAALHVKAVIAVADRLIERRQFLGMRDDHRAGHRLDRASALDRHAHARSPSPASPCGIEVKRPIKLDRDRVADGEIGIGIGASVMS